jgi:hypothetical protein
MNVVCYVHILREAGTVLRDGVSQLSASRVSPTKRNYHQRSGGGGGESELSRLSYKRLVL